MNFWWFFLVDGAGDYSFSPEDFQGLSLGASPMANRFLCREPPDGCEKVETLKVLEQSVKYSPCIFHHRLSFRRSNSALKLKRSTWKLKWTVLSFMFHTTRKWECQCWHYFRRRLRLRYVDVASLNEAALGCKRAFNVAWEVSPLLRRRNVLKRNYELCSM